MSKPNKTELKFREFAGAIGRSGVSVVGFAKSLGVTRQAIYQTLANPRKSKHLNSEIERFIRKWSAPVARRAA